MKKHDLWTYFVLTFRQREWRDWKEQYIAGQPYWSVFRKSLCRVLDITSFPYIQTWERHAAGGLHCNVTAAGEEVSRMVHYQRLKMVAGFDPKPVNEMCSPLALRAGFGEVFHSQIVDPSNLQSMAGYLIKLARELTGAGVKCQIPIDAPPHFRRLRATPHLLPPVNRGDKTGWLVLRPMPLNEPLSMEELAEYLYQHRSR